MERIKRRRLTAEGARALIERLGRSTVSVSAFCELEGISRQTLYRWRSIVASEGAGRAESRAASRAASSRTDKETPSGFIDLGALSGGGTRLELKLDLGAGVLLHLVRG
jgi:transposase-like protein